MEGRNRLLLIALGGALGCCLLVIAFLLGRVTARPADVGGAIEGEPGGGAAATTSIRAAPDNKPDSAGLPMIESDGAPSTDALWVPPTNLAAQTPREPGAPALSPPRSADQKAIAAYFSQIERLDDVGGGNPQTFANSMLQSVAAGDFSGFDDLLARSQQQQERLRRIAPPQACEKYHQLALALSGDSVSMLDRLKAALMRGDSAALMIIATEGHALEEKAGQLKSMGESIKRTAEL
jgi:hypothetical protein